ncbi:tellurium resistance terB-like protein subgroup 2 [Marinobacterium zhoushanense]|uniref:Tellurium resistance terB-like protein subgroup 2 n=1 Tax=Marinobacterium zhoushanense TaxID=1679163 RepID=A0ABQ1KXK0_9GAMM|nr:TerB family tellurite resistance protein [Marinobacterium zhoushanense]GGC10779.1 tellurium resistance terB-like protein subgroup 2 [Marinobacterium zhoushanense]
MLTKLKDLLDNLMAADVQQVEDPQELFSLASAVLMVEVIASDYARKPEEKAALLALIKRSFSLQTDEAEALLERAEEAHWHSTDYFRYTSQLNRICSPAEKVSLIENLWRVAYADGELHHYEEHVIRRIADLIHVPHMDFIAAKHRAQGDE